MNRREALMTLCSIPAVASVQVADVGPKDVIVIRTSEHLSSSDIDRLHEQAKLVWPDQKVVVLSKGMSIEIVRQQA